MLSSSALKNWGIGLLLMAILFPLVFDIFRTPLNTWDEARQAVTAQEMVSSGNWLVATYNHEPDLWYTKPLLLIWIQAGLIALLGHNEVAIRLPTMVATLATALLVYGFCARRLRNPAAGLIAGFVLVTARGYTRPHVARTGDFEALLTWWVLLGVVCFFLYLETDRRRWLLLWGSALAAGILTKSVAALLGSPALLLYVVSQRKLLLLLRRPLVWATTLGGFAVPALYYSVRTAVQPAYWRTVQVNELGARFSEVIESHDHPWPYYLELLRDEYFTPWYWLLPAALLALLFQRRTETGRFMWLLLLYAGCWLTVISLSQTKLSWYEAPVYPLLALLVGLGVATLWQQLTARIPGPAFVNTGIGVVILLAAVVIPYKKIIDLTIAERGNGYTWGEDTSPAGFLKRYLKLKPDIESLVILHAGYAPGLLFYRQAMEVDRGIPTNLTADLPEALATNTQVLVCSLEGRATVEARYRTTELYRDHDCAALLILGPQ